MFMHGYGTYRPILPTCLPICTYIHYIHTYLHINRGPTYIIHTCIHTYIQYIYIQYTSGIFLSNLCAPHRARHTKFWTFLGCQNSRGQCPLCPPPPDKNIPIPYTYSIHIQTDTQTLKCKGGSRGGPQGARAPL